jgi:nicotinamidase-related amidase
MLIKAEESVLLVIDVQQRLAPAIDDVESVMRHTIWLIHVASRLGVPVVATEQYPSGLGHLVPQIGPLVPRELVVSKTRFSAASEGCFDALEPMQRPQVVITGTESHVCVLQTALDLLAEGKEVFVVAEATGSRRSSDRELGIERMRQEGCRIVSREMVAFEWLREAGTEIFRRISREFLK